MASAGAAAAVALAAILLVLVEGSAASPTEVGRRRLKPGGVLVVPWSQRVETSAEDVRFQLLNL